MKHLFACPAKILFEFGGVLLKRKDCFSVVCAWRGFVWGLWCGWQAVGGDMVWVAMVWVMRVEMIIKPSFQKKRRPPKLIYLKKKSPKYLRFGENFES